MTVAMSYAGGFISGGHYNPAVTLAVVVQGKLSKINFFIYVFFQIVGAAGAGTVFWEIFSKTPVPAIGAGVSEVNAGVMEGLFSYFLAFVFLNSAAAKDNRGNSFFGISYGSVLYVSTTLIGRMTSGLVNPAVAIGAFGARNFFNGGGADYLDGLEDSWVSAGVPMAGALVAALTFRACEVGGMYLPCPSFCRCPGRGGGRGGEEDEEGNYDGMEMADRMSSLPPERGVGSEGSIPVARAVRGSSMEMGRV